MAALFRELLVVGALAVGLGTALPATQAGAAVSARSLPARSAVEQALTGGLVTLRAPASPMIRIAAGSFSMGSTAEQVLDAAQSCRGDPLAYRCSENTFADEQPRSTVSMASFWLDRTEVTVRDYERCVERGSCNPRVLKGGERRFARPELPVTLVRATDAEAYCRSRGARLPTEAEFERAARGLRGRKFPWGDLYHSRLSNHGRLGLDQSDERDGFSELAPVASFPSGRTPDGFLDLAGNAAEWTSSPYTERHGAAVDPAWGGARVVRGGHFLQGPAWLRGAARGHLEPHERRPYVGFRCARGLSREK